MFIKELIIQKTNPNKEIIRKIEFNLKGLNLIVDETKDIPDHTGNSVGKTTVIKIIDLCLGASSVGSLYKDKDTKSENIEVKNLLEDFKVEAELILTDKVNEFKITRPLYNRGKRKINDEVLNKDEYELKLKEILFNSIEDKPTLRQLIPRFVRIEEKQLDNIINYLTMTSNETYELINLFLLKVEDEKLLSKKNILEERRRHLNNKLDYFIKDENISSLDFLNQRKSIIDKDLECLSKQRSKIDYVEIYKDEINKKSKVIEEIELLNSEIDLLQFKSNMVKKSISELQNDKFNIDIYKINEIYRQAKIYNDNLEKTFEDVVNFHNAMIDNRVKFIKSKLSSVENDINEKIMHRDRLIKEKMDLSLDLLDQGLLNNLEKINSEIDSLNIEKGEILKSIKILEDINDSISNINNEIINIDNEMTNSSSNERFEKFNEYFVDYSSKLYNEKYIFVHNKNWRNRKSESPFTVGNLKGNLGTGKKRGLIMAFDLAYLKYVDYYNIKAPHFIIHDKLENTHINQLRTIFELCANINGQYIVPILKERVSSIDNDIIKQATILELSEENKLFKI